MKGLGGWLRRGIGRGRMRKGRGSRIVGRGLRKGIHRQTGNCSKLSTNGSSNSISGK